MQHGLMCKLALRPVCFLLNREQILSEKCSGVPVGGSLFFFLSLIIVSSQQVNRVIAPGSHSGVNYKAGATGRLLSDAQTVGPQVVRACSGYIWVSIQKW